jgi:3-methyl-2-oxobutanoate hydroxymethyltransferase
MSSLSLFAKKKSQGQKISMVTCYDFWSAQIINSSSIDAVLVGDSLAMVMHGHKTTLNASVNLMALHTQAVSRGAPDKFIVGDMPFMSYRKDLKSNIQAVEKIMKAGAHAIKLEGAKGNLDLVSHIVESGVPVMGHLGLTPQSINQFGGFHVQAKKTDEQKRLIEDALALEDAGCFSIVLECVPAKIAEELSQQLKIATIGIGAGLNTDGQILVLQDMLGMNPKFKPKFLRHYMNGFTQISDALNSYHEDVLNKKFPNDQESY